MLFLSHSVSESARSPLSEAPPGSLFRYSSGDTNLLSEIVKQRVGGTFATYARFIKAELLDKLNIRMMFEPDASGTIVASSFGWGSAREWAKLGLLMLNVRFL